MLFMSEDLPKQDFSIPKEVMLGLGIFKNNWDIPDEIRTVGRSAYCIPGNSS